MQRLQTAFGSPGAYAPGSSPAMESGLINPPALIRSGAAKGVTSGSMTVAAVDRLVHHCHIVVIKGESYKQKAAAVRVSSDTAKPPT